MPLHTPARDYSETPREDREAILLADELGFAEAFVGEHVTRRARAFHEEVGGFGTLHYCGVDWVEPRLARRSLELMATEGRARGEPRARRVVSAGGLQRHA